MDNKARRFVAPIAFSSSFISDQKSTIGITSISGGSPFVGAAFALQYRDSDNGKQCVSLIEAATGTPYKVKSYDSKEGLIETDDLTDKEIGEMDDKLSELAAITMSSFLKTASKFTKEKYYDK